MSYTVDILPDALQDLEEIYSFILEREGMVTADRIGQGIDAAILGLSQLPRRGHIPPELADMASRDLLEIHFKPYRIVYEVGEKKVLVIVIADGRRNFNQLLTRRVLR
jgi:toxin ParE1/3/4